MILCDLCNQQKECFKRKIEGKEYDICSGCWEAIAEKLKGKGRVTKEREIVLLPSVPEPAVPQPEPPEPKQPPPERPPKIWARRPV